MPFLKSLWSRSKQWHNIPLGPISLIYRLGRTTRVSNNSRRHLARSLQERIRSHGTEFGEGLHNPASDVIPTLDKSGEGERETAVIFGVGSGLGFALARRLAASGMNVAMASRNAEHIDPIAESLRLISKGRIEVYGCDVTSEKSVKDVVSRVSSEMGIPHLAVYSVQGFGPGRAIDIEVPAFEDCWRKNCLGGFIVARESARVMAPLNRGTIVLIGSASSLIGRANYLNLSVGKFGLRALSQVLARELWPNGIHVVHLVIDADIRDNELTDADAVQADPGDISDFLLQLHRQPSSSWTSEVDVRPWRENFWARC